MPRGRHLVTLEDAGTYITKLPKAEYIAPEWQAAMEEALNPGGDAWRPDHVWRIGVVRALNRQSFGS